MMQVPDMIGRKRRLTREGRWIVGWAAIVIVSGIVFAFVARVHIVPTSSHEDAVKQICDEDWLHEGRAHATGGCKSK